MMPLKIGRIVKVMGYAGSGKFGAMRVKISLSGCNYEVDAYAKPLGEMDLAIELLTAIIGRSLGLPIPEPVLAAAEDGLSFQFASIDVKFPNLCRRLALQDGAAINSPSNLRVLAELASWGLIHQAASFDEWIINEDRNMGNILYSPAGEYWLIDHNLALRLPFNHWQPINNILLNIKMAHTLDEVSRQRIRREMEAIAAKVDPSIIESAKNELLDAASFDENRLGDLARFLHERLMLLSKITTDKVIVKQQSLC